ncbi:MAG: hypothetical protein DMD84_02260 [Candidatus Rokuibacteriota bacterium]|nr:MAG: hypothetical protein DMD84_02260 [Candidatus Rokubacteria bacterium]
MRGRTSIRRITLDAMIGEAIVIDLTFKGTANARIGPEDLEWAERALRAQGITIEPDAMLFLRTDWPRGHVTTDPKWWDESPCLTNAAAEWLVAKRPKVLGYDFAQEEKGGDYEKAEEILTSGMRVHRTILPKVVYQIENLTNLHDIPSKVKVIALPAKWKTESAPARVIALID